MSSSTMKANGGGFQWNDSFGEVEHDRSVITFWGNGSASWKKLVCTGQDQIPVLREHRWSDFPERMFPRCTRMSKQAIQVSLNWVILEKPETIEDLKLSAKR